MEYWKYENLQSALTYFRPGTVGIYVWVTGWNKLSHFLDWHLFQICNIPLLSDPKSRAKCLNIFLQSAVEDWLRGGRWWGGGWLAAATIRSQRLGKIYHLHVKGWSHEIFWFFASISFIWAPDSLATSFPQVSQNSQSFSNFRFFLSWLPQHWLQNFMR